MNSAYLEEKNKLASSGAWVWLVEIRYGDISPFNYANNNEKITFNTIDYQPISLSMDDMSTSTSGAFPEYKLMIGDAYINSDLRTYLRANNGFVGGTVRLMVVHSAHFDLSTPAIDETAEILSCDMTAEAVVFTIGIPSLLSRRFPRDKYVPGFCRHRFKGALCKYTGSEFTTCNHTLDECRERSNSQNYGGSPGIIGGVYG